MTGAVPLATTPWSDTLSMDPAESAPWVDFRLRFATDCPHGAAPDRGHVPLNLPAT